MAASLALDSKAAVLATAIDGLGNVYIAGYFTGTTTFGTLTAAGTLRKKIAPQSG